MTVEFGIFPVPNAAEADELVERVIAAEQAGLDLVGIQDHPYQRRFLDTWSLIPFLAARTSRIRFFPDVANLPLRPPAVMAKAAATIDLLSGGRFELGLGAGAFWEAIGAMGGPQPTPREAVDALEEAIQVIRLMWSGERSVSFEGEHYTLEELHPGPQPAHDIGIWLGAYGPRMMRVVGRLATAGSRASRASRSRRSPGNGGLSRRPPRRRAAIPAGSGASPTWAARSPMGARRRAGSTARRSIGSRS